MAPTPAGAPLGQEDQSGAPAAPVGRGQEAQGRRNLLESRQAAEVDQQSPLCFGAVPDQITQAGQVALSTHAQVMPSQIPSHGNDVGGLLFQPGVLEALSSAVAARIAIVGGDTENNALPFKFNAAKNPM